ncbi:MAG TPA: PQQ-dependent sugar dehydrogenase [Gaiellaceae bacterium]|jgi:glucose/arabinose dehydrogenase
MSRLAKTLIAVALGVLVGAGVHRWFLAHHATVVAFKAPKVTTSYSFAPVVSGFDSSVYVTSAPGDPDTLYVVEQAGTIRIVREGKIAGTFLDIRSTVKSGGEQGLLSMAFSPHYASNHLFYVSYTDVHGNSRIARYKAANGRGVRSSGRILLALHQPFSNHNGGQLQFDKRGYLYIGFGDGGSEGDPNQNSQNMRARLGKLLRAKGKTPGHSWKIVGLGLRNPWRFSFDPANDNLWIGDVGQDTYEEVDFRASAKLDKLANYGWSRYEGYSVFDSGHRYATAGQKAKPVIVYSHAHGCSISGGYVYRGAAVRAARGRYFYGDFCEGTIWSFRVGKHGRASTAAVSGNVPSLSSFGVDGHGELYAVSLGGTLYKLR